MEPKKTLKADLTAKTFLFFNIGMVAALLVSIFAFTYKTPTHLNPMDPDDNGLVIDDFDVVLPTEHLTPPPPRIQQPVIQEVRNDEEVQQDLEVDMDIETDVSEQANEVVVVEVDEPEEDREMVFTVVEESASPVGGLKTFYEFISKKIKYPAQAKRMHIEGKVFIEFIVERDGTITDVKMYQGIGGGCDEEAVRVVSMAPKWNPGKQRGKPVRQKMIVPIIFQLN
jgi:periplasmic protein TonB